MRGFRLLKPEGTIRVRWASSRPGFGLTPTAWTAWSGCAGRRGSSAPTANTREAGGERTSPTAGTIFDRTRTPLTVWFTACWLFASQKDGISALSLKRAVCEQLIESTRAAEIERRIVRALGSRCPHSGLRDVPSAAALAGCAPARLESFDLSARRAIALVRVAREVAAGRIDLDGCDHNRAWRRLLAIPTIGRWTVELFAQTGQGRYDIVPAGDLNYLKLLGRWQSGGNPAARADEDEVRALFARYGEWAGLAAAHALRAPPPCGSSARDCGLTAGSSAASGSSGPTARSMRA